MKKFHPFFTIGTIGMTCIACLHIFLALVVSLTAIHPTFLILYPVFSTFLILGVTITVRERKSLN